VAANVAGSAGNQDMHAFFDLSTGRQAGGFRELGL
jgi:hypothetical protein